MKTNIDQNQEYDLFSLERREEIVLIRFKENLLVRTTDLAAKETLLDYLDLISKSDSVKVLLIIGSPLKTGCEEYLQFYHQFLELKLVQQAIPRMYNAVNQFILKIVDLNKIVIHVDAGKIISMFLNVSLACDYRIVGDNTVFQNPCLEFGLLPKGGGALFLSKMLGLTKALEILLSGADISAEEAERLGIVNKVVPVNQLEETALLLAQDFAQKPAYTLSGVKKLLNYSRKDFEDYLSLENDVLLRIVESVDFRKNLEAYFLG